MDGSVPVCVCVCVCLSGNGSKCHLVFEACFISCQTEQPCLPLAYRLSYVYVCVCVCVCVCVAWVGGGLGSSGASVPLQNLFYGRSIQLIQALSHYLSLWPDATNTILITYCVRVCVCTCVCLCVEWQYIPPGSFLRCVLSFGWKRNALNKLI